MTRPTARAVWLAPALIVLLAAALRLYRLDLIDFRFDQAYPLWYAQDIAQGRLWGMQPHGSVAAHPAAYLYVMALPYLFTKNFLGIVVYRVFFDVLTVALCAAIGRRYANARAGLIAALLYAVAPWPVQFARNLWPVCQPLFSAILLIGVLEIAVRANPRGWLLAGLGLALVPGTHLGGVYLLPVVVLAAWLGRRSFRWRTALPALIPGALVVAAYVIQDAGAGFASLRALTGTASGGGAWRPEVFERVAWLSGGLRLSALTGAAFPAWSSGLWQWADWIDGVQVLAFALALLLALFAPGGRSSITQLLLALWVLVPLGLQLHSSRPVEVQYLTSLLPAPQLLVGIALARLLQPALARRALRLAARAGLIVLCAWQVATTLRFTNLVDREDTAGGYGQPVRSALAARAALIKTGSVPDTPGLVALQGFPTPWNEPAVIARAVFADVPHRFINSESDGLVFRQDLSTPYVIAPGADALLAALQAQPGVSGVITASAPSRTGTGARFVFAAVGAYAPQGFVAAPQALWESGIGLRAQRVQRDEQAITVELLLQVVHPPPDRVDYHWFLHVFVGDEKRAGVDIAGVHPSTWRTGDLVLMRARIALDQPLPPGPYRLRVGSYTYPDVQPVTVVQPDKQPDYGVDLYFAE